MEPLFIAIHLFNMDFARNNAGMSLFRRCRDGIQEFGMIKQNLWASDHHESGVDEYFRCKHFKQSASIYFNNIQNKYLTTFFENQPAAIR